MPSDNNPPNPNPPASNVGATATPGPGPAPGDMHVHPKFDVKDGHYFVKHPEHSGVPGRSI